MGIFGALTTAVTGMRAQSFALENVSGNIANSQTTAFKRMDTSFVDLIPDATPSKQLAGSVVANSRMTNTIQGDVQAASIGTYMAINGDGFFVVQKPSSFTDNRPVFDGIDRYTRRGDFQPDKNGYLVNGAGYYLMGIPVDPSTGNLVGSVPTLLQFQNDFLPAQATTQIEYRANLQTALTDSIETLANTSLVAASAVVAADNFFNGTPQRVSGPPATATALVAGTPADTVTWYIGENGPDPARSTATARVDTSITVSYGLRANEEGIRWMVQNVAALAAVTFSPTDPDAVARNAALNARVGANLGVPAGTQTIMEIETELAGAQHTLQGAGERHRETKSTLAGMLEQIEGVSNEQVVAEIMALQVRLQASLQTTSLLYQTSLVNYL